MYECVRGSNDFGTIDYRSEINLEGVVKKHPGLTPGCFVYW